MRSSDFCVRGVSSPLYMITSLIVVPSYPLPPPHLRLAKSTLTLIPLLGIHQVVFIFLTDESTKASSSLRLTKLFVDLFLSSFQVEMKCFAVSLSNSCFELFCF